jgi:hypothetical protein
MFSSLVNWILSLRISYPYLINFHDFADTIPARWGWTSNAGCNSGMTLRIIRVCTGNLTALGRCSNCGRLHHLTRAALFQSMLDDGRDISSIKVIWQTPKCVCFQSFFNHVNCVSFNLVRGLYANLIARCTHKMSGVMMV